VTDSTNTRGHKASALALSRALALGWREDDLSPREIRILLFLVTKGTTKEPGMERAYFPFHGQDHWAATMAMTHGHLRKVLHGMCKRGLLTRLPGSVVLERYSQTKGFGLPDGFYDELNEYVTAREELSGKNIINIPNTAEDVYASNADVTAGEHACSLPVTRMFPTSNMDNPLTRGNAEHSREVVQRKSPLQGWRLPAPLSDPPGETPLKTFDDDFSVPKDERGEDTWAASKESKEKPPRRTSPTTRLCDHFHNLWLQERVTRRTLSIPWSSKMAFQANLKRLLADGAYTEEEITEMMNIFFRQIGNSVQLRSDELWKDFWNNRATLHKMMKNTTRFGLSPELQERADRDRERRLREHQAKKEANPDWKPLWRTR
jgi:hypothetical protein